MSRGQLEALAVAAHKDTRELRRKHGQPSGLTLPAVHGGGGEGGKVWDASPTQNTLDKKSVGF